MRIARRKRIPSVLRLVSGVLEVGFAVTCVVVGGGPASASTPPTGALIDTIRLGTLKVSP